MSSLTCSTETEWGRCLQRPLRGQKSCGFHLRMANEKTFRPDRYYHEKVARGLLEPTDHYITQTEANALMNGRPRNDGRRLDHWTR